MITTELNLNSCPCVIERLHESNGHFIVGCYELIEGDNRKGILYHVRNGSIAKESLYIDGGVFDLKICQELIFVATSSGNLLIFSSNDLKQISSVKICDSLLTSVDIITCSTNCCELVVTNSVGELFIVIYNSNELQVVQKLIITRNEMSIWKVNVFKAGSNLILVGSDDGCLKIFNYSNGALESKCLVQNSDASSGVTAINSFINSSNEAVVVTGSYDEHLRIYQLHPSHLSMMLVMKIHIPGSGLWKIRVLENQHLLIAGMYSGVHEVILDGTVILSQSFEDESSIEKKQLIYDAIQDESCNKLLIASFYKQKLLFFDK